MLPDANSRPLSFRTKETTSPRAFSTARTRAFSSTAPSAVRIVCACSAVIPLPIMADRR